LRAKTTNLGPMQLFANLQCTHTQTLTHIHYVF